MANLTLDQLRLRHSTCISWGDIRRDVMAGAIPSNPRHPYEPACSHPEDGVCAHPNTPSELVLERLPRSEVKRGRPRKDAGE